MPSTAVYRLGDRVFIHPWQRTTLGLGMASKPYISLSLDADAAAVGDAVFGALSRFAVDVPHPASAKGLQTARLRAAGVRSEKAFQTGARSLTVERQGHTIRIVPSRNGGSSGDVKGFHSLPELGMSVPLDSSVDELGAAVRACFERCT